MPRIVLVLALLTGLVGPAAAQSSIFGVRALGVPQAPLSARSAASGGSGGLFDGMSGTNPAAITSVVGLTAGFNFFQDWRSSTTPGGSGSAADAGMPFVSVVNRIKATPVFFSGSAGTYTDRDFGVITTGTTAINGTDVAYRDSLQSRGGITDMRLAVGYVQSPRFSVGVGFHILTGSNRLSLRRTFGDTAFSPVRQRSELAYRAFGVSLGVVYRPSEPLVLAATLRRDGSLTVERDSIGTTSYRLPWTVAGGVQYHLGERSTLSAQVRYTNWSVANAELLAAGGTGAENTLQVALGAELLRDARHPGKLPLRLGVRAGQLPFPLAVGQQPTEFAVSAGSGTEFADGHAALDLALQRVWRRADGGSSDGAWTVTFGMMVKP